MTLSEVALSEGIDAIVLRNTRANSYPEEEEDGLCLVQQEAQIEQQKSSPLMPHLPAALCSRTGEEGRKQNLVCYVDVEHVIVVWDTSWNYGISCTGKNSVRILQILWPTLSLPGDQRQAQHHQLLTLNSPTPSPIQRGHPCNHEQHK